MEPAICIKKGMEPEALVRQQAVKSLGSLAVSWRLPWWSKDGSRIWKFLFSILLEEDDDEQHPNPSEVVRFAVEALGNIKAREEYGGESKSNETRRQLIQDMTGHSQFG